MNLGDEITAVLPELRTQAESMMRDTCTIRRFVSMTTDPVTGQDVEVFTQAYPDPDSVGRCKVGGDRAYETDVEGGGNTVGRQRYTLHLPVTAGPLVEGDQVTIESSVHQPHLVGRQMRIAGRDERSWQTAQRVFIDT